MSVDFRPAPAGVPPASDLIAAMVAEVSAMYGAIDGPGGSTLALEDVSPPGGVFLVGWDGDMAVAGGGVRTIGLALGEIKRMYVVPSHRGRGVARLLLGALESAAGDLGCRRVRLDTGPQQVAALHLYQDTGYRAIVDYNGNRHATWWGEKALQPRP